jgi:hypothetical protein
VRADAEKEITDRDLISIIHQVRRGQAGASSKTGPTTATVH